MGAWQNFGLANELTLASNIPYSENSDRGNINRLASFRNLTGEILMDSHLDNLYLPKF